jgi:DNA-binding winged helix-turn-helix (wHTH) protein
MLTSWSGYYPDGGRPNGGRNHLIQTVRHQGYRLVLDQDQVALDSEQSATG